VKNCALVVVAAMWSRSLRYVSWTSAVVASGDSVLMSSSPKFGVGGSGLWL